MYICSKLITNDKILLKKNNYRYSFGPNYNNLDGIVFIDTVNVNNSKIEKNSKGIYEFGGIQLIVALIIKIKKEGKAPDTFVYANG